MTDAQKLVARFEAAMDRFHSTYADPYADAEDRGDAKRTVKEAREALVAALANTDKQLTDAYAEGRKDEREACARECAAIADGFVRSGEGNKDGRYDWMVAGAQECADALRETSHDEAEGKPNV